MTKPAQLAPLHDYALVADGERGALIGPHGDVAWMCFPGWADDPLFAGIHLGPGEYVVAPDGPAVTGGYYELGTLIFCSRWATSHGIAECHEALVRPPPQGGAILLRQLRAEDREIPFHVRLAPAPRLGDQRCHFAKTADGCFEARVGAWRLRLSGARGARHVAGGLELELRIQPGKPRDLVLEISTRPLPRPPPMPQALWAQTRASWRGSAPRLPQLDAARDARLAACVLQGLTPDGGGLVAAVTSSLPERAGAGRNYDYRYTWIRDQCYAGLAAAEAGLMPLFDQAVGFIAARLLEDGPDLRPVYTTRGTRVPAERPLQLPGYPGTDEVRLGNRARSQFQLDVFGEALLLFAKAAHLDRLDAVGWRAASIAARAIEQHWSRPDSGVWELAPAHWTYSWLTCSAGLRGLSAVPRARATKRHLLELADLLVRRARKLCTRPDGAWKRTTLDPRSDASLVMPAVRGAFARGDPRTAATLRAVERELMSEGLVFRFRHGPEPLGSAEGAFLICQFWMTLAYLEQGRVIDAVRAFERGLAAAGAPGLYTEEYDVDQRQNRGNLPQAFVHAALLEAALRLEKYV